MKDGAALDDVLGRLDANLPAALERLKDFVRIPSVGTDPAQGPTQPHPPSRPEKDET